MRRMLGGTSLLLILLTLLAALALWPVLDAASRPAPRSPEAPPAGGLSFEAPAEGVDVGILDVGAPREVEVPWRRVGRGPLRVRAVRPSCGCLSADGLGGDLEPGAAGHLRLRLAPHSRLGPFSVTVHVFTDAPSPADLASLRVRGFVGREPVLRPTVLDLGALAPAAEAERRIEVHVPPGSEGCRIGARLTGLSGGATLERPLVRRAAGADVVVRIRAPESEGAFRAEVEVGVGGFAPLRVPVRGHVTRAGRR